jgi:hypothetical protein
MPSCENVASPRSLHAEVEKGRGMDVACLRFDPSRHAGCEEGDAR